MDNQKLLLMAENIVANFAAYPKEQQIQQTIKHIEQFWTPEMRQDLKQQLPKDSSALLQNIVEQI